MAARRQVPARATERGAVAVEFALVLPLLLLVVFGAIQFGFVFAQQATLASAARTGARYGSVNIYSGSHLCSQTIQTTRDAARTVGMQGSDVSVVVKLSGVATPICQSGVATPSDNAPCTDALHPTDPDNLTVQVKYQSPIFFPIPGFTGAAKTLTASSTYQCEYS